jgi:hypothetical protein
MNRIYTRFTFQKLQPYNLLSHTVLYRTHKLFHAPMHNIHVQCQMCVGDLGEGKSKIPSAPNMSAVDWKPKDMTTNVAKRRNHFFDLFQT